MSEAKHSERWLSGYYYSFEPTGCHEVDVILSAVARAGKAYHHTENWESGPESPYEPEIHRGANAVEWIQNAAIDAARAFEALRKRSESS